ncbi:hypothetical protein D3273_25290 [Lichenibacterium minor]|uniref:Uncharacterized protein n=1 Tax=Lichenibacterium minor TaxID=2316528 RepID=A0A4Q2TYI9_9HYPH|nr:hypothetical protein [Lichenibacterium minor]RYC29182.1 hypothetical protein D3273_25290 [Lichenibacterium minor]
MVTFRIDGLDRLLRNLGEFERQIPFAMAQALNRSADQAREELPAVWAQHITARNPNFLKSAMTTKGERATKSRLRVVLYDRFGTANLNLHDKGGTARARGAFAIATRTSGITARRGQKGVPKGLRPRNLANAFAKTGKSGDLVIYQRSGKYQKATKTARNKAERTGGPRPKGTDNRHLRLEYVTKPTNPVRADVPLSREFYQIMRREAPKQFAIAMRSAMKNSFRK